MERPKAGLRNVINPGAAQLAAKINSGGDLESLVRGALTDAIIHNDWKQVAALENSLQRSEQRSRARELQALAGRGVFISRLDPTALAQHIPAGFDFGIAWLVCAVFLHVDGDFAAGAEIAEAAARRIAEPGKPLPDGVVWSAEYPLVNTTPSFGPPSRVKTTAGVFAGDPRYLRHLQQLAVDAEQAMDNYSATEHKSPLPIITWGCLVTGVHDPSPLFEPQCPVDTLDLSAAAQVITGALAEAAGDEECFIHPQLLSATAAYDFAVWSQREQLFENVLARYFANDQPARALVSPLVAPDSPYMDHIMVSYWTRYDAVRFSFRFPRSTQPLGKDVERTVAILKSKGIEDVRVVLPKVARNSNLLDHITLDAEGRWQPSDSLNLGRAERFLRRRDWPDVPTHEPPDGPLLTQLPAPHILNRVGVGTLLSEHFQKAAAQAIKVRWSQPGDPWQEAEAALRELYPNDGDVLDEIARYERGVLRPRREEAVCAQFKLANGACALVTPALQTLLEEIAIPDQTPGDMLRPPFDLIYLYYRQPWAFFDPPDTPAEERDWHTLDGVMVQRYEDADGQHLLLDALITGGGPDSPAEDSDYYAHLPVAAITVRLAFPAKATLGDLLQQARAQEEADDFDNAGSQWLVRLVAGTLLYMNSRDARMIERPAPSPAAAKGPPVKGPRPEQKPATFGCIVVGPEEPLSETPATSGGRRPMKIHYRRGYVRVRQRVGKGRKDTRPVFIHPVLVNAKLLREGAEPPPKKDYVVGADKKPKS